MSVNPFDASQSDFTSGVFSSWLEEPGEGRRASYFSAMPESLSPNQRRFFENQYQNVFNDYLGQIGSQIRGGGSPTASFAQFTQDFPFSARYAGLPQGQRVGSPMRTFAPRTRFLTF